MPTFLTVKQLAEILQVTERTLYDMAKTGKIPHLRIGRRLRFDLQQVQHAFAQGQNKTFHPESVVDKIRREQTEKEPKPVVLQAHDWSSGK